MQEEAFKKGYLPCIKKHPSLIPDCRYAGSLDVIHGLQMRGIGGIEVKMLVEKKIKTLPFIKNKI